MYIVRLALVVLLPLLLALAPAMAQTVVYQGKSTPLSIIEVPGNTYEWEIYSDVTVDFATVSGNCPVTSATFTEGSKGANVNVNWLKTGIYFFKVTARDAANCAMNFKLGMIKVIPVEIEAIIAGVTQTGACEQVKLDGSKSIGNALKYEWSSLDQGGTLTRQSGVNTEFLLSPSFKDLLPAEFRVQLLVTDSHGFKHTSVIAIQVDRQPVADVFSTGKLEKDGSMLVDATVSTGTEISYKWRTTEGKIIGADNGPTAKLNGVGIYSLEITDNHGCKSTKSFKFPLELHQINASDDYVRISWSQDTIIPVLDNDHSTVDFISGSVRIIEPPTRGGVKANADGTITYVPRQRKPGRDQFVYQVCDAVNLCASATVTVDIYDSGVRAPEGFSPNGDGINELLVFKGLDNYLKSQLYVFTRSGQLVYQSEDYLNNWDGTNVKSTVTNKELLPTGTYYYVLKLGGTNRSMKGFVYISY